MNEESIQKAITKLGGELATARHLEAISGMRCTRDMVAGWKKIGVPVKWALWLEQETQISRHLLAKTPLPLEINSHQVVVNQ